MGGIQNHADEDADRKTNFFLCIKCFQNSRTNLFILGVRRRVGIFFLDLQTPNKAVNIFYLV